ncbi:MAG: hypothetical protein ACUVXI_15185 [bacterium]
MICAEEVKRFAKEARADLIGIANIERFADIPAEHNPTSIFPDAKSVIVVGKRITRGTLRGVEEGTQFDLYNIYGRNWLNNRILAMTTFRIAEFLEDNGWEAVPLPNLPPEVPPMGIPVRPNQPAPNVMIDFDDAAVRVGLGELGYCGFLLTPEFGPRQRIQMILTDAELEPDPILEGGICDRSGERHAEFCPLGAINPERERTVRICGKEMVVADVNYERCKTCKNGAHPNPYHPSGKPDRLAAICARNCLDYLERNSKIKNIFRNPFRKRPPWGIIEEMRVL